jgi:hypothetical protein
VSWVIQFSLVQSVKAGSGLQPAPNATATRVKRPKRQAHPVQTLRISGVNPLPPIYLHDVHRDNFTADNGVCYMESYSDAPSVFHTSSVLKGRSFPSVNTSRFYLALTLSFSLNLYISKRSFWKHNATSLYTHVVINLFKFDSSLSHWD